MGSRPEQDLDMFIIDVLRHHIEDIEAILRMLNNTGVLGWRQFWPDDFDREEVMSALERLLRAGLVSPLEFDSANRVLVDAKGPIDVRNDGLWYKLERPALDLWNDWKSPKQAVE